MIIVFGYLFWRYQQRVGRCNISQLAKPPAENLIPHLIPADTDITSEIPPTNDSTDLDYLLPSGERVVQDVSILSEYTWAAYTSLPPVMKQTLETAVLKNLLATHNDVSLDSCSAFLKDEPHVRALLLQGWAKGTFKALRGDQKFISLSKPIEHRKDNVLSQLFSKEPGDYKLTAELGNTGEAAIILSSSQTGGEVTETTPNPCLAPKEGVTVLKSKGGGVKEDGVRGEDKSSLTQQAPVDQMTEPCSDAKLSISESNLVAGRDINVAMTVWRTSTGGDAHEIANWFFGVDYRITHNDIGKKRSKNTGKWFLQKETYEKWHTSSEHRFLFCPGIPGVGKTVMASLVVDHLRMYNESQTFVIYFNYKLRDKQNKLAILEALCRQIFEIRHDSTLKTLYESHEKRKSRPTEAELRSALSTAIRSYPRCFLVLDALDEYTNDYSDKHVCEVIEDILSLGENVKLLVTSRLLGEMATIFKGLGASQEEIIADDADMRAYVAERVDLLTSRFDLKVSDDFPKLVVEKVIQAARGRFLVAELGMNLLSDQPSRGDLRDALDKLPNEIDQTYAQVVTLIKGYSEGRRELAMRAIKLIACARRQLSVQELQHALATKHGRKEVGEYIIPLSMITGLCAGLIVVQDKEWKDQPDGKRIVRFVHFTAQEFFERSQLEDFNDAHKEMFSTCIEYLTITGNHILPIDFTWSSPRNSSQRRPHLPFYDYSALNWGYHASAHPKKLHKEATEFLSNDGQILDLSWEYTFKRMESGEDDEIETGGSAIFLAAYHEQVHALPILCDQMDTFPRTQRQRTPLHIAVMEGWTNAVKAMLQWSGSDYNSKNPAGHDTPPQSTKRRCGDSYMVLENAQDQHGRTPISYAAENGEESIATLLLQHRFVEVELKDNDGLTPLCRAVRNKKGLIVKLLLEHGGIEINTKDNAGRSPLMHAMESVYQTPRSVPDRFMLFFRLDAAHTRNKTIIKLLLNHKGVDVNMKDNNGLTPFSYAVRHGDEVIVKHLLVRGGVDVNTKDNNGQTPLSSAIQGGKESIAMLLLKHGGIDADYEGNGGWASLSYATKRSKDEYGANALSKDSSVISTDPCSAFLRDEPNAQVLLLQGWKKSKSEALRWNQKQLPLSKPVEYDKDTMTSLRSPKEAGDTISAAEPGLTGLKGIICHALGSGRPLRSAGTVSHVSGQQEHDEAIGETLFLLKRSMASARKQLNILLLDTAISKLCCALEDVTHPKEMRITLHHHLKRALLTRYSFFGCIEDLEACVLHEEGNAVMKGTASQEMEKVAEVQSAIQLIVDFRRSVDTAALDDIIRVGEESISLYTKGKQVYQKAELLILLGNALTMRCLGCSEGSELIQAAKKMCEAEDLCRGNVPLSYISVMALTHIEWIRATEWNCDGGMMGVQDYMAKALEIDEKGAKLCQIGTKMAKEAGGIPQLEEAIAHLDASLRYRLSPHPKRWSTLINLADALLNHFTLGGNPQALEGSVDLNREVLMMGPMHCANRALWLYSQANTLMTRFKRKRAFEDLEECIRLHREALDLRPPPHPNRSTSLTNLADALSIRFDQIGVLQDLEESVRLCREALDLRLAPHPNHSTSLITLSDALSTRFKQTGAPQDVEESIRLCREALDLQPLPHPDRSATLNSLASALAARFKQKGATSDLEESIRLHREALDLRPSPHPNRSTSCSNLADALISRFERLGALQDIENSIQLCREALDLQPPPHPDCFTSLNALANALSTRFKQMGATQDIEESIRLCRAALDLQPLPQPARLNSLHSLATSYASLYERNKEDADLEHAFHFYKLASLYETGSLLGRLNSAKTGAAFALAHRHTASLGAYIYALELLSLLASTDFTLNGRRNVLKDTNSQELVGDAARCAISQNQFETAVVCLSTGRSIFWSQALQLRTSVVELAANNPILAERYLSVSRQLEQASHGSSDCLRTSLEFDTNSQNPNPPAFKSLSRLADQRRQTIDEIRRIPGFEGFLLPPTFTSLRRAAHNGPVVLLNTSNFGCDALIMHKSGSVEHIAVPDIKLVHMEALKLIFHRSLVGELRSIDSVQPQVQATFDALRALLLRDLVRNRSFDLKSDPLQVVLEFLWITIVQPVVEALSLQKTDSPRRIWWCPSGSFASLPIHAAGIYTDDGKPIDCLSEYAVSSYCNSPQDLIRPQPQIPPAFKMTAIIEPEAFGGNSLPATLNELDNIYRHIPDNDQLIARLGLQSAPNEIDVVLPDIQRSSIVHFGCHGFQNPDDPLESFLLLSGGKLTMSTIIRDCQISNSAALAYLSACETAKGDEDRPDESLNLVATMMFAGFRSVVGTMWSIYDADAPIVADVFYSHLFRNGKDAPPDVRDSAYALHLATAKLREQGRGFRSWVPYVHYGI